MDRKKQTKNADPQRRTLVIACIACAVVLAGLITAAGVMTWQAATRVYPLVRAEAGLPYLDPDVFLTDSSLRATFDQPITAQQLSTPGTYDVRLLCEGRIYSAKLEVVDTLAPSATASAVTSHGELPAPEAFIAQVADATAVTITYKTTPDVSVPGEQTVTLLLTDAAGNVTELTAQLTVVNDELPLAQTPEATPQPGGSNESTEATGGSGNPFNRD